MHNLMNYLHLMAVVFPDQFSDVVTVFKLIKSKKNVVFFVATSFLVLFFFLLRFSSRPRHNDGVLFSSGILANPPPKKIHYVRHILRSVASPNRTAYKLGLFFANIFISFFPSQIVLQIRKMHFKTERVHGCHNCDLIA